MIVLKQSEQGRHLRVIGCLNWRSTWSQAVGYIYDGTRVNQLKISGPLPAIETLFPFQTGVGSRLLSFIGRRYGLDDRIEYMSLSCCRKPCIRIRRPRYKLILGLWWLFTNIQLTTKLFVPPLFLYNFINNSNIIAFTCLFFTG